MPTFRSSIYRIIVIIQCFLMMSLVLPGLTVPAIDSKLAIDARQTTTSVNSDQLSRIDNPASLIGHLRFLERVSDTAYTVRDPSNRKVYSSPSLSRPPEARVGWTMPPAYSDWTYQPPTPSESIDKLQAPES